MSDLVSDLVERLQEESDVLLARKVDRMLHKEAADEIERLRAELADTQERLDLLANEMVYRGNSVAYIYQKMDGYRATIDRLCEGLRKRGIAMDGKTSAVELAFDAIDAAREGK